MNRKMRLFVFGLMVVLILAVVVTPALAELVWVKDSTKTKGVTTITWDSSFADFDYTCGNDITMTVDWNVDAGTAEYAGFALKENKRGKGGFTPRSKKDPATGTFLNATQTIGDSSVDVSFRFTGLHLDKRRGVDVGNAHFKLYLNIDTDGDEVVDSVVGYGVNVHVEDPKPYGCP